MSEKPLISIITPFLNREDFLAEAIESVFAQTYEQWELLLVDDGSTDGSADVARRYAAEHPDRVRYLAHADRANRGPSASRNLARRHARGEWIALLDSDDVWYPVKLHTQLELLRAHPGARVIVNASQYWHGWTGHAEDLSRDRIVPVGGAQDAVTPPPRLLEDLYPLGPGNAPCVASVLLRSDLLEQIDGWEEDVRDPYEDQYFLTKIYLVAPVYIASLCLDRYRIHPTSFMKSGLSGDDYHTNRRRYLDWFEAYLADRGLSDSRAGHLVRRALWPYRHPRLSRYALRFRRTLFGLLGRSAS
jgi:glycosyltransferase involved in cell wall biosynthesis